MTFSNLIKIFFVVIVIGKLQSCKPEIHSFTATPKIVINNQKVHLEWKVSGTPTIEFEEHLSQDSIMLLKFDLIVKKGDKEVRSTQIVERFKDTIMIVFATTKVDGEFVIAEGERDFAKWSNFQIVSVNTEMPRELIISHSNVIAIVSASGIPSAELKGTTASGTWVLKTRMTKNEINTPSERPNELTIRATIKPVNF